MTRNDFLENVYTWEDLLRLCYDYDLSVSENIITYRDLQDTILDDIEVAIREGFRWFRIRDYLVDIDADGEYFSRDGLLLYSCIDDDFRDYKDDVLDEMDTHDLWDEEEESEEDCESTDIYDEEDISSVEPEDLTLEELFEVCNNSFAVMSA